MNNTLIKNLDINDLRELGWIQDEKRKWIFHNNVNNKEYKMILERGFLGNIVIMEESDEIFNDKIESKTKLIGIFEKILWKNFCEKTPVRDFLWRK